MGSGRDRNVIAICASLAIIVVGCQSSAPTASPKLGQAATTAPATTTSTATASPPAAPSGPTDLVPAGTFTAEARPLDLTVETDDARTTEAFVDRDGATLEATGADGTTYTLTIPRDAVWPPTSISMTPLGSIGAGNARVQSGALFGVRLEPSGLELLAPARLLISPATVLDDVDYFWFSYHDQGRDAAIALADPNDPLALPIDHFSGAGIVRRQGSATGGDDESGQIEVLFDQIVSRMAADCLSGVVGHAAGVERNAALLGQDPPETTMRDVAEAAQWRYLDEVIPPLIRVAGHAAASCADANALIGALLDAARQRGLLGLSSDEEPTALDEAYDAVAEQAYPVVEAACRRDAARACRETGDITETIRRALTEQRSKALLGRLDELEALIPDFYQDILKWCAVYELTWASSLDTKAPNYKIGARIEGHLTLRIVDGVIDPMNWPPRIEGETTSALVPLLVSVTCSATEAGRMICAPGAVGMQPTRARITKIEFGSVGRKQVGSQQLITNVPSELEILFQTSPMMLEFTLKPNCRCPDVDAALEIYATTFNTAHEPDQQGEFVKVAIWQRANHPLLWKKTYADGRRKEKVSFKDTTVFELTHTPGPEPASP